MVCDVQDLVDRQEILELQVSLETLVAPAILANLDGPAPMAQKGQEDNLVQHSVVEDHRVHKGHQDHLDKQDLLDFLATRECRAFQVNINIDTVYTNKMIRRNQRHSFAGVYSVHEVTG